MVSDESVAFAEIADLPLERRETLRQLRERGPTAQRGVPNLAPGGSLR